MTDLERTAFQIRKPASMIRFQDEYLLNLLRKIYSRIWLRLWIFRALSDNQKQSPGSSDFRGLFRRDFRGGRCAKSWC